MAINTYNLDGYAIGNGDITTLGGTSIDLGTWDSTSFQWSDDTDGPGVNTQVMDLDHETHVGVDDATADPTANEGILVNGTLYQVQSFGAYEDSVITMADGTTFTFQLSVIQLTDGTMIMQFRDADIATMEAAGYTRSDITDITFGPTYDAIRTRGAENFDAEFAICFSGGTLIAGHAGHKAVETLKPGDLVMTADRGPCPVRWIGQSRHSAEDLRHNTKLLPIRISASALGPGLPARDLVVSRQHRILVASPVVQRMFGCDQAFLAAKDLLGHPGIAEVSADDLPDGVTYYHVLLDQHEVLFAENAPVESLLLAEQSLASFTVQTRSRLRRFLKRFDLGKEMVPARQIARGQKARRMVRRHDINGKALVQEEFRWRHLPEPASHRGPPGRAHVGT